MIPPSNVELLQSETAKLRVNYDSSTGRLTAVGKPDAFGADAVEFRVCDSLNLCTNGKINVEILGDYLEGGIASRNMIEWMDRRTE